MRGDPLSGTLDQRAADLLEELAREHRIFAFLIPPGLDDAKLENLTEWVNGLLDDSEQLKSPLAFVVRNSPCGARADDIGRQAWLCTRPLGHPDRHEASEARSGQVARYWPRRP